LAGGWPFGLATGKRQSEGAGPRDTLYLGVVVVVVVVVVVAS
jgi:hypothetical protein